MTIATKRCSKCKEVKPFTEFHNATANLYGKRPDCKACVGIRRRRQYADDREKYKQYSRDYRLANPELCKQAISEYQKKPNGRYAKLKCEAKIRGIELLFSFDEYVANFYKQKCRYCRDKAPLYGHGVDRKDSSKPYTLDNCVPCCGDCNCIKNDLLTYDEMMAVAQLLIEMRKVVPMKIPLRTIGRPGPKSVEVTA